MLTDFKVGQVIGGGSPETNVLSIAFRVETDNGDGSYDVVTLNGTTITYELHPRKSIALIKGITRGGTAVRIKYAGPIPDEFESGQMSAKELLSFMASQVEKGVTQ